VGTKFKRRRITQKITYNKNIRAYRQATFSVWLCIFPQMFLLWVISTSSLQLAHECTLPVGNFWSECHFSVFVHGTSTSCFLLLYHIRYREITQLGCNKSASRARDPLWHNCRRVSNECNGALASMLSSESKKRTKNKLGGRSRFMYVPWKCWVLFDVT
jgi:hypothetical protein